MQKAYADFETHSEIDLRKVGLANYAQHESTEVNCIAYALSNEEPRVWYPGQHEPTALLEYLESDEYLIVAHNAEFEEAIFRYVFTRYFNFKPPHFSRFTCTAARCAALALPRKLEKAALALKLPIKKDMEGSRLMKKYMKPRKVWVDWKSGKREGDEPLKYFNDQFELWALYDYCKTDVKVMRAIDQIVPHLIPQERESWLNNLEMNKRGIKVDVKTVLKVKKMIEDETINLNKRLNKLTNGEVESATKVEALKQWCYKRGAPIEDLTADSVRNALEEESLTKEVREALTIRKQVSKTSIKKYFAIAKRLTPDGRVKNLTVYHGAWTGREAGSGVQVQNLPRGKIKDTYTAIINILTSSPEDLKLFYGNLFELFSSCIRSCIVATPGHELFVADFNAIECRVLYWLADHNKGLEGFLKGIDQYKIMAEKIFGIPYKDVGDDSDERFIGKQVVLGCGYQMGPDRFLDQCHGYGATWVEKDLAKRAIEGYRKLHYPIPRFWSNLERAAIKCVNLKKPIRVGHLVYHTNGSHLQLRLPSGRDITYPFAKIKNKATPWGEMQPKLYYMTIDSKTKQWVETATYGGALTEHACQSVARDITDAATKRLKAKKYLYLFQVHDELVSEKFKGKGSVAEYNYIIEQVPEWAKGLPIKAGGWSGYRYKK